VLSIVEVWLVVCCHGDGFEFMKVRHTVVWRVTWRRHRAPVTWCRSCEVGPSAWAFKVTDITFKLTEITFKLTENTFKLTENTFKMTETIKHHPIYHANHLKLWNNVHQFNCFSEMKQNTSENFCLEIAFHTILLQYWWCTFLNPAIIILQTAFYFSYFFCNFVAKFKFYLLILIAIFRFIFSLCCFF
jgi:hypothetical protein